MKPLTIIFMCIFLFYVNSSHSGNVYKIDKATISASGGTSASGNIQIKGSIGQAEASNQSTGGVFTVNGGIWTQETNNDIIFKNGFEN